MDFKTRDWDFICTECNQEGIYDLIIYNPLTKELYFEADIEAKYISGVDSYGNSYSAAKISRELFDIIFNKLFKHGGYTEGFFCEWENDEFDSSQNHAKTKRVPKEIVFKGIRGELSPEELDKIVQVDLEKADYYDFDSFISMIHKFLRGEISREHYRHWVIVVSWALSSHKFKENSKKYLLYNAMSYGFDGHSFDDLKDEKEHECYEVIASLKHDNHLLKHTRKSVAPPFYNEDGSAIYIHFDYCNHYNEYHKICVVDEQNKTFKIDNIVNPFYYEHINYNFVDEDEFDDLSSKYYGYFHDKSIDIHEYIGERPYLDVNGNEIQ